jgi:hypothetical protein
MADFVSSLADPANSPLPNLIDRPLALAGYLRREDLAAQLGVSPRTVDRWNVLRCGPPRIQIGRTILYDVQSVRDWLRSREETVGPSRKAKTRVTPTLVVQ